MPTYPLCKHGIPIAFCHICQHGFGPGKEDEVNRFRAPEPVRLPIGFPTIPNVARNVLCAQTWNGPTRYGHRSANPSTQWGQQMRWRSFQAIVGQTHSGLTGGPAPTLPPVGEDRVLDILLGRAK